MGPVVSEGAMRTILEYIDIGKKEGRLLAGGKAIDTPEKGYYVAPTVIADVLRMRGSRRRRFLGRCWR